MGNRPQRTCLGCRLVLDQDSLVRYVLSPLKEVLVDYRRKLPGRGAYTHVDSRCLHLAVRHRQFSRAFKSPGIEPEESRLLNDLAGQIRDRILGLTGMARKSGAVLSGSNLVLDSLRSSGEIALVLLAEDISEGVGAKVKEKARHVGVPCFSMFDKETLGGLLGKGERSVVAVAQGALAGEIEKEFSRYKQIVGEN